MRSTGAEFLMWIFMLFLDFQFVKLVVVRILVMCNFLNGKSYVIAYNLVNE